MTPSRAVLWLDQRNATLQRLDGPFDPVHIRAHPHQTRYHRSDVRTSHDFHAQVCDALEHVDEILVSGAKMTHADFRHYVDKHRPQVARRIVAWQVVDHPTEPQMRELAQRFFARWDRMAPSPAATI
jgi:hypothetical protein